MTTFYDITPNCPANRWAETKRCYTPEDVLKLRGSVLIEHTLAKLGSAKLWKLLHEEKYVHSLGALTGNQAMQMVRAGLKAIYLSGWQVAADNNTSGMMYPDQSIYPVNSGPELCRRINNTLIRADQIEYAEGAVKRDWLAPIIADAEAGFGGAVNCFEIVKAYIQAGVSAVHFEDQLSSEKKCGHLGGKVLIPTRTFLRSLSAARLAADVCGVATLIIARTDAQSAQMITSDVDPEDEEFIDRDDGVTAEGFHRLKKNTGLQHCIKRGLASAPYADLLWWETSTPNLRDAKIFADAIHEKYPGKMLAYNCSPSFNWEKNLDTQDIATFQQQLADMGYKYQFITLAGFHCLNYGMYELASSYKTKGMSAFADLQRKEFAAVEQGFTAVRHQREVGTGYFDKVALTASGNQTSTTALKGSTETDQFYKSQKSADASVAYLNGVHAENGDSVNAAH